MTGPAGCNAAISNNATDIKVNNFADSHGFNLGPPALLQRHPDPQVRRPHQAHQELRGAASAWAFNIPNGFVFGIQRRLRAREAPREEVI